MPNTMVDIYYKPYLEIYGGTIHNAETDIGNGEVTFDYSGFSGSTSTITVNDLFVTPKFGGRVASKGTKSLTLAVTLSTFAGHVTDYISMYHSEDILFYAQPSSGYYKCLDGVNTIAFNGTNTDYIKDAKILSLSETIKQTRSGYAERFVFNKYSNTIKLTLPKDLTREQLSSLLDSNNILLHSHNTIYNTYSNSTNYNYYMNGHYGTLDPLVRPVLINEKETKIVKRYNSIEIECVTEV
jgi:hypothetical protein